ncbi:MAG TPA: helix-turn-helix domain-containing protein [Steroidobacteraceae bacterium]|nr:helix-turn-helix domain-containing protein [Steroidobacteraceae bacterium]
MSRPLAHPDAAAVTLAGLLFALADPVRLAIVRELLKSQAGLNCTETTARTGLSMPKSTCSQHYRILRESGLIESERRGTELVSRVRTQLLAERFPGLLDSVLQAFERESRAAARRRVSRASAAG